MTQSLSFKDSHIGSMHFKFIAFLSFYLSVIIFNCIFLLYLIFDIISACRPQPEEPVPLYEATVAMETIQRCHKQEAVVQL